MPDSRFESPLYPVYQPARRMILSITKSYPLVVITTFDGTTAGDNGYYTGLIVRIVVPRGFGMYQANGLQGTITKIDDSSFSVDIDSTSFDTYVIPLGPPPADPAGLGAFATAGQVIPIGEVTSSFFQSERNVLPY